MKKIAHLYFPKAVYSEFDAIAPLLLELCQANGKVYTVVFDSHVIATIENSFLHKKIFQELGDFYDFSSGKNSKLRLLHSITQIFSIFRFIIFILSVGIKYQKKNVLFNWPAGGINQGFKHRFLYKIILFTARFIGSAVYSFPGIQAPYTKALFERFSAEGAKKMSKFEKRGKGEEIKPTINQTDKLVFTDEHRRLLREVNGFKKNIHTIGLPRLYASWQDYRKKYGAIDFQKTLSEIGLKNIPPKCITILVTNPEYPWFKKDHDFYSMLEEAVASIRLFFPNEIIFLKTKPSPKDAPFEISDLIKNYQSMNKHDNVYIYVRSLASLADNSIFCLSIAESSGIFDFLTAGIPAIEYSDYCEEYLQIFPEINPWAGTPGFFIAHNVDDLRNLIRKVAAKKVRYSHNELCDHVLHRKNLQALSID